MFQLSVFTACADIDRLGHMKPDMLTEEQRMELFFTADNPQDARDKLRGDPEDACSWTGVRCYVNQSFREIDWHHLDLVLHGSIDFLMFPSTLKHVSFILQKLYGEMDVSHLPDGLQTFSMTACLFTGKIDIGSLPHGLDIFMVSGNQITGIQNITNIPRTLTRFIIEEEKNTVQEVRVGKVPMGPLVIDIEGCNVKSVQLERASDAKRVTY